MILDGYPIPWAIRFGKLASLLLREPRKVPIDEYRASCPDMTILRSGGRARRNLLLGMLLADGIYHNETYDIPVPSRVPHEPISPFLQRPSAILGVWIHNT